jgi:hypothetical protein
VNGPISKKHIAPLYSIIHYEPDMEVMKGKQLFKELGNNYFK